MTGTGQCVACQLHFWVAIATTTRFVSRASCGVTLGEVPLMRRVIFPFSDICCCCCCYYCCSCCSCSCCCCCFCCCCCCFACACRSSFPYRRSLPRCNSSTRRHPPTPCTACTPNRTRADKPETPRRRSAQAPRTAAGRERGLWSETRHIRSRHIRSHPINSGDARMLLVL